MDLTKPESLKKIATLKLTMTYGEIIAKYKLDITKEALRQRIIKFKKTGKIVSGVKRVKLLAKAELQLLIDKDLTLSEAVLQVKDIVGIAYTQHDIQYSCKQHRLNFKDGRHRTHNKPPVSIPLVKQLLEQKKTETEIGLIIDRCILRTRQYIKIAENTEEEIPKFNSKKTSKSARHIAMNMAWRKQG